MKFEIIIIDTTWDNKSIELYEISIKKFLPFIMDYQRSLRYLTLIFIKYLVFSYNIDMDIIVFDIIGSSITLSPFNILFLIINNEQFHFNHSWWVYWESKWATGRILERIEIWKNYHRYYMRQQVDWALWNFDQKIPFIYYGLSKISSIFNFNFYKILSIFL